MRLKTPNELKNTQWSYYHSKYEGRRIDSLSKDEWEIENNDFKYNQIDTIMKHYKFNSFKEEVKFLDYLVDRSCKEINNISSQIFISKFTPISI